MKIARAIVLCVLCISLAQADVTLPKVIDSHMVLQQGMSIPIWGTAAPGEMVTVTFAGKTVGNQTNERGSWAVVLEPLKATAKGQTLTVKGKNTITLTDVLVGEVWVGSGQSNMEWNLAGSTRGKEFIAGADKPKIRLFHVPKVQSKTPAKDVKATWTVCTPKSVPRFSAVLYQFGLRLQKDLKVSVGLINSSWGGSPIEPWTVTDKGSGGMYNAMIAPLQPFAIRGALWYQGETNVMKKNGLAYFDRKKALIEGWRKTWGQDLAFYFVQIAPWSGRYEPGQLPALWEAQAATLKLPRTGMVVITDLVDKIGDIHPRNKYDVGNRLALWALAKDYGKKDLVYSGPLYRRMRVEGSIVRLGFAHNEGLKSRDGKPLSEFQVAGADGTFVDAKAKIDGKTVLVRAEGVKAPVQVRFGWHKVANPNLVNGAGLPASPFQTKDWTGGTGE